MIITEKQLEFISDRQLVELHRTKNLHESVLRVISDEMIRRNINPDDAPFTLPEREAKELNFWQKVLIILLSPIGTVLQGFFAAWLLDKGYKKIHQQYWRWLTIGFAFYFIVLLILAYVLLRKEMTNRT